MPSLINQVPVGPLVNKDGTASPGVQSFLSRQSQITQAHTQSGPTSQRPTATSSKTRWLGMPFFDLTLGKPVYLKSVAPDVWVDATGTPV